VDEALGGKVVPLLLANDSSAQGDERELHTAALQHVLQYTTVLSSSSWS
jgi:hypothetical protein